MAIAGRWQEPLQPAIAPRFLGVRAHAPVSRAVDPGCSSAATVAPGALAGTGAIAGYQVN